MSTCGKRRKTSHARPYTDSDTDTSSSSSTDQSDVTSESDNADKQEKEKGKGVDKGKGKSKANTVRQDSEQLPEPPCSSKKLSAKKTSAPQVSPSFACANAKQPAGSSMQMQTTSSASNFKRASTPGPRRKATPTLQRQPSISQPLTTSTAALLPAPVSNRTVTSVSAHIIDDSDVECVDIKRELV